MLWYSWFWVESDGCRVCEGVGGCSDVGGFGYRLSVHRSGCDSVGRFGWVGDGVGVGIGAVCRGAFG